MTNALVCTYCLESFIINEPEDAHRAMVHKRAHNDKAGRHVASLTRCDANDIPTAHT